MRPFTLVSEYSLRWPARGHIRLTESIDKEWSTRHCWVLRVRKTFTIANVIQNVQRPTLVIAHNKTCSAIVLSSGSSFLTVLLNICQLLRLLSFTKLISTTDTYIEKNASINEEIERLRLSATRSLLERRDVIVVSSVSCIYSLGSPQEWRSMTVSIAVGKEVDRSTLFESHQYTIWAQWYRAGTAPSLKGRYNRDIPGSGKEA